MIRLIGDLVDPEHQLVEADKENVTVRQVQQIEKSRLYGQAVFEHAQGVENRVFQLRSSREGDVSVKYAASFVDQQQQLEVLLVIFLVPVTIPCQRVLFIPAFHIFQFSLYSPGLKIRSRRHRGDDLGSFNIVPEAGSRSWRFSESRQRVEEGSLEGDGDGAGDQAEEHRHGGPLLILAEFLADAWIVFRYSLDQT
ncbi:unnamed protein product [Nesidiocoris tenuis]|uniref:Uncharacterized protein n=1 Tax=Nesidiocoris tenuis TaxID=355587 RepID=A0A6H5H819_9HEMI|nr:unnamed protein product [Nesidiocoris tenuis]